MTMLILVMTHVSIPRRGNEDFVNRIGTSYGSNRFNPS